jgi:hypothetical protein
MTTSAGTNMLVCEGQVPSGVDLFFTVQMQVAYGIAGCVYNGTKPQMVTQFAQVFWGDRDYTPCGGNGHFIGSLQVFVDGVGKMIDLVNTESTASCAPTSPYCNGHVSL